MALFTSNGTALFDVRVLAYLARPTTHGLVNTGTILLGLSNIWTWYGARSNSAVASTATSHCRTMTMTVPTCRLPFALIRSKRTCDRPMTRFEGLPMKLRRRRGKLPTRSVSAWLRSLRASQDGDRKAWMFWSMPLGQPKQRTRKAALLRNYAAGYSRQCMV